MQKAIVLSETPNGMPTRHYKRDPHDLGPKFNAMREKQRQDAEKMAHHNRMMMNSAQGLGQYADMQNHLGSILGGYGLDTHGRI